MLASLESSGRRWWSWWWLTLASADPAQAHVGEGESTSGALKAAVCGPQYVRGS